MFSKTVIARVGLPKATWEPLRKLRDQFDVPLEYLAQAWGLDTGPMLKVLYAARLQSLEDGEEVEAAVFLDRIVGEMTHD